MSKEKLKIKPVEQDLTKEDLKKVNGGGGKNEKGNIHYVGGGS